VAGGNFFNFERFGGSGTMAFGVGQIYATKYFGADAKAKIENLVANLRSAFRSRIEHLDWMEPSTKTEALKKLDAYYAGQRYPAGEYRMLASMSSRTRSSRAAPCPGAPVSPRRGQ